MKIEQLIQDLQRIAKIIPDADVYFTDGKENEQFETNFQAFNVDEENNCLEVLLSPNNTSVNFGFMKYATITTQHNIVDILMNPEKYIDEYSDTEILTLPDESAEGGILRFLIGVEDEQYYVVVEDDYCADDVYPDEGETLMQTFVRVLNDNLARE